jgi:ABC-type Fe3+-hydroxamate transport system substrate-binding protein
VIGWGGTGDDVPGHDTLFNTIVETAGGVNVAATQARNSTFDLEQVLRAHPEVLLRGAAYSRTPALRNTVALHRVLRQKYAQRLFTYPEAVFGCGVPRASQLALELAGRLDPFREAPLP